MTRKTVLAVRHVPFEDLGVFAPMLADRGYGVRYLDAGIAPIMPQTFAEPDLLVVLGGPIGVYDDAAYPWLAAEQDALATRLHAGLPTLGICLGAQLIARALGARVAATGRKEIGYGPLTLTPAGRTSVLAPLAGQPVLHWHGDQFEIPTGAERLAATPGFPHQAFRVGGPVLALQFHVEADAAQIERWLIGHAHELGAARVDPNRIREDAAAYGPALADKARDVLGTWLDEAEALR